MSFDYDLFVIGAGPGGVAAARQAANYGVHVAIAERDRVGGTCVIHGCIPEKLLAYAASFSHVFEDADEYGWGKVSDRVDWHQFMAAKDRAIARLSLLHIQHLQEAGVELMKGHSKFLDPHTLDVGGRRITADKILIAVGGEAVKPNIPGVEYAITSRQMFELKEQPEHLAIIGSDQIAMKFAGSMNGLYVFGFAFGLLIFQALFMKDMLGGSYVTAVRRSFMPEWLSMNAVMAGMIPVMVILMSRDMTAMEATSIRFWGVMSLATLVGLVVAFPVNMWLVWAGLKHGMGTVRALGKGGHSLVVEAERIAATSGEVPAPNASTYKATQEAASSSDLSGMKGM